MSALSKRRHVAALHNKLISIIHYPNHDTVALIADL